MTEDADTAMDETGEDFETAATTGSEPDFEPDSETVGLLREVAADVRGDTSESKQVAAFLQRTSDLYDPEEETSPEEIYRNMRNILNVKESGGLQR